MARLAIISGQGSLPVALAAANPDALVITLQGVSHDHSVETREHRFEALGALFDDMRAEGVNEVVLAGGMARPSLDPSAFDTFMQATAPRLMAAFQQGDDQLLRLVITLFEEQGFAVRGAHDVLPSLTADLGQMAGPTPSESDLKDAAKAADILRTLAPLDVGQGVTVAAGLCLGIETLQGTDALLDYVGRTPSHLRRAPGVFVKAPKAGQDLRVDMPTIGPATVARVAKAGLAGIVVAAGRVLILDRAATFKAAENAGVFLLGAEDLG